jgi:serine/threonine-protein kinase
VFELLTGHPPFTAASPAALMELHAGKPAPTLASAAPDHSFTPQLEHLVAEALAKKPARRSN